MATSKQILPAALSEVSSAVSAVIAAIDVFPFNERGVIPNSKCELTRSLLVKPGFEFTVRAHPIGAGQWISACEWSDTSLSFNGPGHYPHIDSKGFPNRMEAIADAMDRGMREVVAQLGTIGEEPHWAAQVESLSTWVAQTMANETAADQTLPLSDKTQIDLFCGGSGCNAAALGSLGMKLILAVEKCPKARAVYEQNYKPAVMHDDICTLDGTKLKCDVVSAGPPCQPFSVSGKQLGMDDPKYADVYRHFLRLVGEIDTKVWIIECSKGLITLDAGKHFKRLKHALMQAGFKVQFRILNAKGFGLPQSRERALVVATRIGLPVDDLLGYIFPKEKDVDAAVEDILDVHVPGHIPASSINFHNPLPTTRVPERAIVGFIDGKKHQGNRVYSPKGIGISLTASSGGKAPCTGAYLVGGKARGLTPREACRMQGLPEWTRHHTNTRTALKHAGNAVAVPMVRELGRQLATVLQPRS